MIDLLVIEPSISVRKTLERLLESSGYAMRGVTRAADALGQVSRQRPDLILSEVTLPDTGGLELCQQFRLVGLPVLLMSSRTDDQLRRDSRDAGALELLSKPLSEQLLLGRLAYHLKLPTPAPQTGIQASPTLLSSLMTRPGILGAALVGTGGKLLEQIGSPIPAGLYQPFLAQPECPDPDCPDPECPHNRRTKSAPLATTGPVSEPQPGCQHAALQCAQLEYPEHCLLLFRLPNPPADIMICLIQNSSYASLIKYYLRSSPFVRL